MTDALKDKKIAELEKEIEEIKNALYSTPEIVPPDYNGSFVRNY